MDMQRQICSSRSTVTTPHRHDARHIVSTYLTGPDQSLRTLTVTNKQL